MDKIVKAAKPAEIQARQEQIEGAAPKAAPRFIGKGEREKKIPLEFPLEYDDVEYHDLTIRRLQGKDFSRIELLAATFDEQTALMHLMTGAPIAVIKSLDGEDFVNVAEAMDPFVPARWKEMAEAEREKAEQAAAEKAAKAAKELTSETGENTPQS